MPDVPSAFFSYSREDSEFALRLAGDLKAAGAGVWLDQLDISPGQEWDSAIEDALNECPRMLLILSPDSAKSRNVRNEISRALDEKKSIIPVFFRDCTVPLQLARVQFIDFRSDYARGLKALLKTLGVVEVPQPIAPAPAPAPERQADVADAEERKRAADQARLEQERKQAAERARLEEERRLAAEQARLEEERRQASAEKARLEEERRQAAAEKTRLEQQERERLEQERDRRAIPPEPQPGFPVGMKMAAAGAGVVIIALVLYFATRPKPPEREVQKPEVKAETYNPPTGEKAATGNVEHPPREKRPPEQKPQPDTTEWVNNFLTAWGGPAVPPLRPYFDETVSPYFSIPTATWADIAKDKQYYFNRFPTLHYTLVGQPNYSMQQDGQGILEFESHYSAIRKDGKAVDGTEHVVVNIRSVDGQWKITGMKGQNVR